MAQRGGKPQWSRNYGWKGTATPHRGSRLRQFQTSTPADPSGMDSNLRECSKKYKKVVRVQKGGLRQHKIKNQQFPNNQQ